MRDFDRCEREALDRFITGDAEDFRRWKHINDDTPVNDVDDDSDPEALNEFDEMIDSRLGRDDDAPRRDWLFNLYRQIDKEDKQDSV